MDAPLTADALIRPWRTATLVASLVAAVELIVLIAVALLLLAKPLSRAVRQHAEASALAPAKKHIAPPVHARKHVVVKAKHPRSAIGVFVFNGNGRTGAASSASAKLSHLGYRIRGNGNAKRQDYATSVVMYQRGYEGEGIRLAHDLHVHVVGPLDGMRPAALHGGKLAVVLGAA
jgi:LytR cell envelope-related transcriptional attenuator